MTLPGVKIPLPVGGLCDRGEFDEVRDDEAIWLRDVVPNENSNGIRQRNGFQQVNQAYAGRVISAYGWRMTGSVQGIVQLSDGSVRPIDLSYVPSAAIWSTGVSPTTLVMPAVGWREASAGNARLYFLPNDTSPLQSWDGVAASSSTVANAPLNCTCMALWRGRLIMGGVRSSARGHRVFYSDVGDPNSPASSWGNNWVDLIDESTSAYDWIVGFGVAGDYLVVFKRQSVWVIYDPVTFNNRRISDIGAIDWPSITEARGRVWWVASPDRLMSTDGVKVKEECPQVKFYPGEWQRVTNADTGRTWLAATEDELYVAQQNPDSQRELVYVLLDRKNDRGEYPCFKHMHRRTLNEEASVWNPGSSGAIEEQYMQGVWTFPDTAGYTPTVTQRARKFVFGGYSGAAGSNGRMWTIGSELGDDQVVLAADTADAVNEAPVLAQYMQRLPFREMEKFERVRRVNFYYTYAVRLSVVRESDTKYLGTGFSRSRKPSFAANFTGDAQMVGAGLLTSGRSSFARFRPEVRGRSVILHVQRPIGASGNTGLYVYECEAVFRGGKEH